MFPRVPKTQTSEMDGDETAKQSLILKRSRMDRDGFPGKKTY